MLDARDTIAAISTGAGEGGIAIVRASGARAIEYLRACFRPSVKAREFERARMHYGHVVDARGDVLDEALAVCFYAPNSYTREHVAEIHCHGGRACAMSVLNALLELGARAAEPGEFTKRAFMNGRVDLCEAEAVMQLIQARSKAALRASARQLTGGVSAAIGRARGELTGLNALIAACVDFPEELDERAAAEDVRARAIIVRDGLARSSDERFARIAREGASVVIIGRPNVGKSSVLNALLRCERAIVTEYPGTTRDVLTEQLDICGLRVSISDTAGLRDTDEPIERMGVERARHALDGADCAILLLDASAPMTAEDEALIANADDRYVIALNKCDLPVINTASYTRVSAYTGEGIDELAARVASVIGAHCAGEDSMILPRHIECARNAISAIDRAVEGIDARVPLDFIQAELDCALNALGEITGESMSEAVIERVFADFCVGK